MYMGYQKIINSNIKELRVKNGLTQEEFAEKIGISIQGLSNIERNRYQPTAATIDKICDIFGLTPIELLLIKDNDDKKLMSNINILLRQCSVNKLRQIYEILLILTRPNKKN